MKTHNIFLEKQHKEKEKNNNRKLSKMVAAVQSPATQALLAQHTICKPKETTRQLPSNVDSKLSRDFFTLNFNDDSTNNVNAFPVIEWDNSEESDSDSIRSIDSWKTVLTDWSDSSSERTLGKRGRLSSSRRLLRSKKIKSNLASLARSPTEAITI